MNIDDITKYWNYLEVISLLLGVILVGGAITVPNLNKITEDLLNQHVTYLILILAIGIIAIFAGMFTGASEINSLTLFTNAFKTLFLFSSLILVSIFATIFFTTNVNWPLVLGLTLILNYIFTHFIKL